MGPVQALQKQLPRNDEQDDFYLPSNGGSALLLYLNRGAVRRATQPNTVAHGRNRLGEEMVTGTGMRRAYMPVLGRKCARFSLGFAYITVF
jgi:hypothetical protein